MSLDLILSSLSPTVAEITGLFGTLAKVPSPILKAILSGLDEQMLRKLATWSQTYVSVINDVHFKPADPPETAEPKVDFDYFAVLADTRYIGERMTVKDLELASNLMTKAIKATNWQQAVMVGVSLGRAGLV